LTAPQNDDQAAQLLLDCCSGVVLAYESKHPDIVLLLAKTGLRWVRLPRFGFVTSTSGVC
jgi:hypothetical protein